MFKRKDILDVDVPKYDEFSVKKAWLQIRDKPEYTIYFKEYSENAIPTRSYLYSNNLLICLRILIILFTLIYLDIINTVSKGKISKLVKQSFK